MSEPSIAASRFQFLESPSRLPGKCAVCGRVNVPVVDFGANLHQMNSVWVLYLCFDCVNEAVRVFRVAIGIERDEEQKAAHSFDKHLADNNLKVITNEQYDNLVFASEYLGAAFSDSFLSDLADNASTAIIEEPDAGDNGVDGQLEFDFDGEDDSVERESDKPKFEITL